MLEPMHKLIILVALFSSFALASPSCQELIDSVEVAFEKADEVIMDLRVSQAIFEVGYIKLRLFKNAEGVWDSENLEQRGLKPPEKDEGQSAEPTVKFNCQESQNNITITDTSDGWNLLMIESDKDKKVKRWILDFSTVNNLIVPTKVVAEYEIAVLLIPIAGQAVTNLSNWRFP